MTSELPYTQPSDVENDIKSIVDAYSEADREEFTSKLLEVLSSSNLVRILDEDRAYGPSTLREVLRVCQSLGKIDASLAWVVGVSNSAWSMRNYFDLPKSSLMAIDRNKILAMVLGRPGLLKKNSSSGEYLLTGEWRYASGWRYSSFFFCLATVEGAEASDIRVVSIPAEQMEVSENWLATGLRGTQSVTVRAHNILVPNSNIESYARILSGENRSLSKFPDRKNHASYAGLFTGVLMCCLIGAMLGAAEAALEYVVSAANSHRVAGSTYASLSESGAIRAEIGRLRSALDLYKRAAEYNTDVIDKAARDPDIILTVQDKIDSRARATQVMRGCVNIVQDILWIYGSSGLDKGCPLERIWRDVNVGARHGGFSKFVPEEAVGMAIVGHDPKVLTQMF